MGGFVPSSHTHLDQRVESVHPRDVPSRWNPPIENQDAHLCANSTLSLFIQGFCGSPPSWPSVWQLCGSFRSQPLFFIREKKRRGSTSLSRIQSLFIWLKAFIAFNLQLTWRSVQRQKNMDVYNRRLNKLSFYKMFYCNCQIAQ